MLGGIFATNLLGESVMGKFSPLLSRPWLIEQKSLEQVLLSFTPITRDAGYCNICT